MTLSFPLLWDSVDKTIDFMYNINTMNSRKLKVYLDNCCYNRPFDTVRNIEIEMEVVSKLFIQKMVIDNKIDLVWSYALTFENSRNPKRINRENIILWRDIAKEIVVENNEIIANAKKYQSLGVRQLDAIHIACSVYSKCDAFITTDKDILNKKIEDIKLYNPIDFIREVINNVD